jgi:hypothetical protein
VQRPDDPQHYTPEYRAARLDLIRRARQGDGEARRLLGLSWLDMAMKAAAGLCGKRAARVAKRLLRDVPHSLLEEYAHDRAAREEPSCE